MWVLAVILIILLIKYTNYLKKRDKTKPIESLEEEIRVFHIFPDYPKSMPYECKTGREFHFIVKGYTDIDEIREVPINGDKVIWDYTKGNGAFRGNRNLKTGIYTGDSIYFITPEITDPYKKEKLIFISAHYMGLTDATWIKVVR
jgi:hypothetical protein